MSEKIQAIQDKNWSEQKSLSLADFFSPQNMSRIIRKTFKFLDYPDNYSLDFKNTSDFLFLPEIYSAKKHIFLETITLVIWSGALYAGLALSIYILSGVSVLTVISASITLFYMSLMAFKLYVVYRSISAPLISFSKEEVDALRDADLPVYTIMIPLYREEKVIPQIISAMSAIEYPPEKLDIIITLEEYDHETIEAIGLAHPPKHFKTLILPNVSPKTKPKALNVAFRNIKGDFVVIYDAEIVPDPDQLKKIVLAFKKFPEISCFQTRLDHYNTNQNLITKLFNAEFSFYYDLFLPGLQQIGFPIPLSGHSTHFKKSVLEKIGAWDPYNVTEDCDLGMRLYRGGFKTAIIDSFSREEATSSLKAWIFQRTRWMKGFIQTSIVHMRHPFHLKKQLGGWKNFAGFLFTVPSTAIINIFNLFYWVLFISWITTHSETIQAFFPGPILYLSVFSFVIGNIVFTYLNFLGVYRRGRFNLVKYSALSPVYWIMLAIATTRAFVHIVIKPHHWEKTTHGTHLK